MNFGVNLSQGSYYSSSIIVKDLMKTASNFFNSPSGYDVNGYPLYAGLETTIYCLFNNSFLPSGDYKLSADGVGTISISQQFFPDGKGRTFSFDGSGNVYNINLPGTSGMGDCVLRLGHSDINNHIRNIQILMPDSNSSGVYTSNFLHNLEPFSCFRFMKWTAVENSQISTWEEETAKYSHYNTYGGGRIGFDQCFNLCNTTGKDCWINIPHKADDNFIIKLAELANNTLDPKITIYIEYSNEVWNWGYQETQDILKEWQALPTPKQWTLQEYFGYKVGRAINLFKAHLAPGRKCKRVVCTQNGNRWFWQSQLDYMRKYPGLQFDVIATSPYFFPNPNILGVGNWPNLLNQYNKGGQARADAITTVINSCHQGIIEALTGLQVWIDYGNDIGVRDICLYECGASINGGHDYLAFNADCNFDPRMGYLLYNEYIDELKKMGVDTAMFFIDCAHPTGNGFGMKAYESQPDEDAPKYWATTRLAKGLPINPVPTSPTNP